MCAVWVGVYNAVQLGGAWFIMLFNWEGVVAPVFYLEEEALSLSLTPFQAAHENKGWQEKIHKVVKTSYSPKVEFKIKIESQCWVPLLSSLILFPFVSSLIMTINKQ